MSETMNYDELSETQQLVLRMVSNGLNGRRQIAGHGTAPLLSAARSLARKGLLSQHETGTYYMTDAGREVLKTRTGPAVKTEPA